MAGWQDYPDAPAPGAAQPAPGSPPVVNAPGAPAASAPAWASYADAPAAQTAAPAADALPATSAEQSTHRQLAASGYQPSAAEAWLDRNVLEPAYGFPEQAARAASFGLSDKSSALGSAISSAIAKGAGAVGNTLGITSPTQDATPSPSFSDTYHAALAAARGEGNSYAAAYPWLSKAATGLGIAADLPLGPADAAATLAGRVWQGLATGVTAGALSGFGNSNDESFLKTATDTGQGALVGGTIGVAAPIVADRVLQPIWDAVARQFGSSAVQSQAVQSQAVQQIAERMRQDTAADGPTAQSMLDLLTALPNKPQTIADVAGENVQAKAGSLARQPGEARQYITNLLNARDAGAGTRLADDVNAGIASGPSAFDTTQALMQERSNTARPLYEAATNPSLVVDSPRLQQFLADPTVASGVSKGLESQRLEALANGEKFNPVSAQSLTFDASGVPNGVKGVPNMQTLDAVKQGLDQQISAERDSFGRLSQRGVMLSKVRGAYTNELDRLNPDYATARASWAGPSASLDAVRAGQGILAKTPQEIASEFGNLQSGNQEFYKLGAADALKAQISKTGLGGDEAKKIIGSDWKQSQLKPLFPNTDAYNKFIGSVTAENRMFNTRQALIGGSQSAARLAEDSGAGDKGVVVPALQLAGAAATGEPMVAMAAGGKLAKNILGGFKEASPAVNTAAAKMLMNENLPTNQATLARLVAAGKAPSRVNTAIVPLASMAGGALPRLRQLNPLNKNE